MSFSQFTNLDFNTLRAQIKDYLRSNSNFSDFDFEGSNFSILIDTLAYNSYITSYNTNMAVNESFIDSATLRENVVSLARNIGYVPRSTKSAVATINFTVNAPNGANAVKLNKGLVALGAVQGGSYIFSIPDDITVTPDSRGIASFSNISIYEGSYLTKPLQWMLHRPIKGIFYQMQTSIPLQFVLKLKKVGQLKYIIHIRTSLM